MLLSRSVVFKRFYLLSVEYSCNLPSASQAIHRFPEIALALSLERRKKRFQRRKKLL